MYLLHNEAPVNRKAGAELATLCGEHSDFDFQSTPLHSIQVLFRLLPLLYTVELLLLLHLAGGPVGMTEDSGLVAG